MRRRPAVTRIGALGLAMLGVTGLGITGLTGCSAASSSSAPAQPHTTGTATSNETMQTTGTATAAATPTGTASRGPVDRYMVALLAVRGKFEMVGGPVQPGKTSTPVRPLSGVVTFRDSGGEVLNVTVGPSGKFTLNLAPGSYTVTGRSKQIGQQNADGSVSNPTCSSAVKLTVRPGTSAHVTVVCAVP
jgi:hypothetical protein